MYTCVSRRETTPLLETEAKLLTTSGMSECRPPLSAPRQPLPAVQAPKPSTWCCFSVRRSPSEAAVPDCSVAEEVGVRLPLPSHSYNTPCFGNEKRAVNARGVFTKPKLPANWCRLKNITRGKKNRQNKKNAEPRGPRTASDGLVSGFKK